MHSSLLQPTRHPRLLLAPHTLRLDDEVGVLCILQPQPRVLIEPLLHHRCGQNLAGGQNDGLLVQVRQGGVSLYRTHGGKLTRSFVQPAL